MLYYCLVAHDIAVVIIRRISGCSVQGGGGRYSATHWWKSSVINGGVNQTISSHGRATVVLVRCWLAGWLVGLVVGNAAIDND